MAWAINDLELATGSVVRNATDRAGNLTLEMRLTPAETLQLAELAAYKGRIERVELEDGRESVVDTTGGLNTIYLTSNKETHVRSGWYAIEDFTADWSAGPAKSIARLDLALIAMAASAELVMSAETEFLVNDF